MNIKIIPGKSAYFTKRYKRMCQKTIIKLRSLDKDDLRLTSRENHKDSATKGKEVK